MRASILLLFILLYPGFPATAETINLQLRWHHQFQFAGYYAALEKGYYQKAGLTVILHEGAPTKESVQQVMGGHAQYGVANSELLLERLRGAPLVALAAIFQHSPSVLLVRKDSGILSPGDLAGKKVMMINHSANAYLYAMFNTEGINLHDLDIIPTSYQIQDLIDKKTDAFHSYLSNEPYYLKQQGVDFTVLNPRNYGMDFYSDILFTTEDEIKHHPERAQAFRAASLEGWRYAMNHPEEIIELLINRYKVPKSKAHLEFEAEAMRALIMADVINVGHMNPWRWQQMAEIFIKTGMVKNARFLPGFQYVPEEEVAHKVLIGQMKMTITVTILIAYVALLLFIGYGSVKRENLRRVAIEKELQKKTEELALHNLSLQQINQGIELTTMLDTLIRQIELLHPDRLCSILLLDEDGEHLRYGAAPGLPDIYSQAVEGLVIGEGVGCCGTAAHRGERFIVENIQQHAYCKSYSELALEAHLCACWSQPIKNSEGQLLGVFNTYYSQPVPPNEDDIILIESYAKLAELMIESKRRDIALKEGRQRLMLVLEGAETGFWDWRIDKNTVERNYLWAEMLGYSYEEIKPTLQQWIDFIHSDDWDYVWQCTQDTLEGRTAICRMEYRMFHKDGSIKWILDQAKIVQRDSNERPLRMCGTCTDITERKRTEEALKAMDCRKNEFLAMLGHELRNPLAPIRNAVQILKTLNIPDPQLDWSRNVIDRQVDHMTRLIDDLLDVARVMEGKIVLKYDTVQVSEIIEGAVEICGPLVEMRQQTLSITPMAAPTKWVKGDRVRLVQIVANLLNNAVKYTPEGGRISVTVTEDAGYAHIKVKDNGVGISTEMLTDIFGLFIQADRSLAHAQGGLGIGLTLARRLVEKHAGTLAAASDGIGQGSEFTVRLPLLQDQMPVIEAAGETAEAKPDVVPASLRILVVDDYIDALESLTLLLHLEGYEVETADCGLKAIEQALVFRPHVVLLDIGLPDIDGYEVAKRLRELPATRHAVLIALTGHGQPRDFESSTAAGFDYHQIKPIDFGVLSALLEQSSLSSKAEDYCGDDPSNEGCEKTECLDGRENNHSRQFYRLG
jgi:PAS domain S-box-containing protein